MTRLHRAALLLCASTVVLVLLGAAVTSTGAGLSIAAWPSTFGDPASVAPSGAGLQRTHRVVAALVGLLTVLVVALVWRHDRRLWMRGLALGALATVVAQAVYGGIGVLNALPAFVSVFHAAIAQLFLAITIAIALLTSPGWLSRDARGAASAGAVDRPLRRWVIAATSAVYLQIVIGAAMRHSYAPDGRPAGFAIPDYPLAFGKLVPLSQLNSSAAGLDFLHRVVALATVVLVAGTIVRVFRRHASDDQLVRPAALLGLVLLAQVALGGLTVLSGGHPAISTTHAGAVTVALGAALVLAIRSSRLPAAPLVAATRPGRDAAAAARP